MIEFLSFSEETRRQLIDQVNIDTGINQNAVEKDWWVTLVLKALFSLPMAEHFIFKGGTSLSKGWKLIKRFSEDIDIALAPEAFGKAYMTDATTSYVKRLKKLGCEYTSTIIYQALSVQLQEMGVPEGMLQFEVEPIKEGIPDKDPQAIFVHYPPLFEPGAYMLPRIRIEFGVRALREPFSPQKIASILSEGNFPGYKEEPFEVLTVEPRKTYMEKLILLHEKYLTGAFDHPDAERQSRHLSDLSAMSSRGIAKEVQDDKILYATLIKHRSIYVALRKTDYTKMQLHQLSFIPPFALLKSFQDDYRGMQTEMLYGDDTPAFEDIIKQLRDVNLAFASFGLDGDINELVAESIRAVVITDESPELMITQAHLYPKGVEDKSPENRLASFEIDLIMQGGNLIFHRIIRIA